MIIKRWPTIEIKKEEREREREDKHLKELLYNLQVIIITLIICWLEKK